MTSIHVQQPHDGHLIMAGKEGLLARGAIGDEQSAMDQSLVYLVQLVGRATTMSSVH
jgi:hypothetical protein